ncbi:pitrilysin family protein [Prevotella sp. KH2C16]|uniref:M16 family metallopeptidase n=1 Tax=Prevotella sp. KH2C16 TaxID=1855325 RepID=UPI0008E05EFF|nr:pitrilysin family protein [Prevotella sp. KH2C16]SFF82231.1 Predicted Zn-dependent peptidase [Prevotella sp. KH2C16]
MKYNTYKLGNGLRVIHLPSDSPVLYCGYEINAGTRDENPGEEGLAHFCEHVTFKGTARRRPFQIINYLESVGGDLNAFTNKEDTVYYAAILKDHLERAVDLLSDIVFHSVYPQAEIEKEVEVICDEIESYNDSPSELIYDDFENLIFDGHPLGHNILGTAERVRSYTTADALRFVNRFYTPANSIFFAYGDIDFRKLLRLLEKYTADIPESRRSVVRKPEQQPSWGQLGQTVVRDRHTHQAHVMLGTRGYDIRDERRMPLYLLNNMLGGPGMNARLNLALRERHGLVYTVDSSMVSYSDTGLWCTYFGCDADDIDLCLRLVRKELDEMGKNELSELKLSRAKKQIKGQIGVACDNRENFALDFGKSFLHYGWERDLTSLYARIDAITPQQLRQVAREVFNSDCITTLVYR